MDTACQRCGLSPCTCAAGPLLVPECAGCGKKNLKLDADGWCQTCRPVPNWYDGPITMWAVVDRHGTPFAFDNEQKAHEILTRWEENGLSKFGPYRIIRLVEQREASPGESR